jgi:hypothetical protein
LKFSEYLLTYNKISFRKLMYKKTPQVLEDLFAFIKTLNGKTFSISISKFLQKRSSLKEAVESQTYFCSELIATFYKVMGILPHHVPSSRYLPKDFAEPSLQLLNEATLMPERQLTIS